MGFKMEAEIWGSKTMMERRIQIVDFGTQLKMLNVLQKICQVCNKHKIPQFQTFSHILSIHLDIKKVKQNNDNGCEARMFCKFVQL